jgi:hypothetical protein
MSDIHEQDDPPRFPEDDLRVDFGAPAPGSSHPMPAAVRNAYEQRILSSVEAQAAGAQRALQLFIK